MQAQATVYRNRAEPRIGLNAETTDMTINELNTLIDYLSAVAKHAAAPDKYTMPNRL